MIFERWDTTLNGNSKEKMLVEKLINSMKLKSGNIKGYRYMMLDTRIDTRIIGINKYVKMLNGRKISWNNAYVYIFISPSKGNLLLQYPFLYYFDVILDSYLSRRGVYYCGEYIYDYGCYYYYSAPATSLKYITIYAEDYTGYFTIELINLDEVAKNTKVKDVVDFYINIEITENDKEYILDEDEYEFFVKKVKSNQIFANYDVEKAKEIVDAYYGGNKSLSKEVAKIAINYSKIFRPYKICIDKKTWNQVDCSIINFQG